MEHSLGSTTFWGTKQASTNLRVQKLETGMNLEINHRKRNNKKLMITWRLKNMLLKNQRSMIKSKRKFKNTVKQMTMKTKPYKNL